MRLSADQALEALRAAGEPTRLRILAMLRREELAVLEIAQVLDQSQPRVSRHLKLLTEARLIERFADGAWAFYRLTSDEPWRGYVQHLLAGIEDDGLALSDGQRLGEVTAAREAAAADYFARSAARWDEIRSLHVAEDEVEGAIASALAGAPLGRLLDVGTGTGRMLALHADRADAAVGVDRSSEMLRVARARLAAAGVDRAELRQADMYALPLPAGSADTVIVHQVLHYAQQPGQAIAEAGGVLAPGGRLLGVEFGPHEREELRGRDAHARLGFSDEAVLEWMGAAGLEARVADRLAGELTVTLWLGVKPARAVRVAA